jgi:NAD(P)H dehydrogenase (quinone)
MYDGRSGDIDLMLWPVNFNLAYAGFEVLQHFVGYGVEVGLRYSEPSVVEERLKEIVRAFRATLQDLDNRPAIPFNRRAEWGSDGRIMKTAPVYSPFIRRKQYLDIE